MLHLTVAQDGSGDYASVSEAVLAVPYELEAEIAIGPGVYREKLVCEKRCITLRGAGADQTILVWNDRTDTGLASFAEADSTGPGAAERPAWVKQLSGPEAAELLARARTLCRPKTN